MEYSIPLMERIRDLYIAQQGADLRGRLYTNKVFSPEGVDPSEALLGSVFYNCILRDSFRQIKGIQILKCTFERQLPITGRTKYGTSSEAKLTFKSFSFDRIKFSDYNFTDFVFRTCDFKETTFENIRFESCVFLGNSFTDTLFIECKFNHCTFLNSELSNTFFTKTRFRGCLILDKDMFSRIENADTAVDEYSTVYGRGALFPVKFSDLDLSNLNFDHIEFEGSVFVTSCNLSNTSFRGRNLVHSNFKDCNLTGADFSGAGLAVSNFENSDVTGAHFNNADLRAVRIQGGEGFKSANVDGAFYFGSASKVQSHLRLTKMFTVDQLKSMIGFEDLDTPFDEMRALSKK